MSDDKTMEAFFLRLMNRMKEIRDMKRQLNEFLFKIEDLNYELQKIKNATELDVRRNAAYKNDIERKNAVIYSLENNNEYNLKKDTYVKLRQTVADLEIDIAYKEQMLSLIMSTNMEPSPEDGE